MTQCVVCGFDTDDVDEPSAIAAMRSGARRIRDRLRGQLDASGGLDALRTRPAPETWSALEYAGHVRDLLLTHRERTYQTLLDDVPSFVPVHATDRVKVGAYNRDDPATLATEVTIAADLLARLVASLSPDQWSRTFSASFPAVEERDLRWLVRHCAHETVHHLFDIETGLASSNL